MEPKNVMMAMLMTMMVAVLLVQKRLDIIEQEEVHPLSALELTFEGTERLWILLLAIVMTPIETMGMVEVQHVQ